MVRQCIPKWIFGFMGALWAILNTLLCGLAVLTFGVIKVVLPISPVTSALHWWYGLWCKGNRVALKLSGVELDFRLPAGVAQHGWYLLICNHISWLDILVLSANRSLPAPKFFLKDELKYIPLIGTGAWAMGMPFMKRASKAQIAKNPKLKGMDVARTKASCQHFRKHPTTVINFVEGTRFTDEKQKRQGGKFHSLLKPKAGGAAFALEVLSEQLDALLDATIIYDSEDDHICRAFILGKLNRVYMDVAVLPMAQIPQGNYQEDKAYRVTFQSFVNQRWTIKDERIQQYWQTQSQAQNVDKGQVEQV